jgi:DNA-binding Xre family transcriptional regulator
MRVRNQARIRLKKQLAEKDITLTALAKEVGHDISVVSKAINHGRYPRVLQKVKEALCA